MFLRSLVKLNLFQSGILLPNSGADQKKGLRRKLVLFHPRIFKFRPQIQLNTKTNRSSPHSGSISDRNYGFLVAKYVLLSKKPRGPDIFRPLQCQTRGGATTLPPQNRRQ